MNFKGVDMKMRFWGKWAVQISVEIEVEDRFENPQFFQTKWKVYKRQVQNWGKKIK